MVAAMVKMYFYVSFLFFIKLNAIQRDNGFHNFFYSIAKDCHYQLQINYAVSLDQSEEELIKT